MGEQFQGHLQQPHWRRVEEEELEIAGIGGPVGLQEEADSDSGLAS